jgi:hypothetical protein
MPRVDMLTNEVEIFRNEFADSIPTSGSAGYWKRPGRRAARRNRRWEREHRSYRYINVPLEVRARVLDLAAHLLVAADELARALIEYSAECADKGTLRLYTWPNPLGRKMTLFPKQEQKRWRVAEGTACEIPARREKPSTGKKKRPGAVTYRLPEQVHKQICDHAMELDVPLGEVVTLFLRHGLDAYQQGKLELDPQPKVVKMTLQGGGHESGQ